MPADHEALRRLFERALDFPAAQREAFLAANCAGNADLHRRLQAMLVAAEDQDHFLSMPTVDRAPGTPDPAHLAGGDGIAEGPGSVIGPYSLRRQLGEGGFGVVFLAEQKEPVARTVALKILKPGMDTRQVVARFAQERQALALMDHPNIAKVLDAGATTTGRPYFVMDYVPGVPVTEYCDRNHLTIDERLRLFGQICQAVQHAHGKGVIHRDLKPSNVLVATHEGKPVAKVIDFGVAKATSKLTDQTLFTEQLQILGTFQYMSPEQAEGSPDIDTRSDVYSLGVLLYELLTGTTPFDRRTLRDAMYAEVMRQIREVEPQKPSTRLSSAHDTLAGIAAQRRIEPRRLPSALRGDLDWIVMKALEKDRQRRYDTASSLAQDIERHLRGEAIVAAPPSAAYRVRKFVRRHRGAVAAAIAIAASLVAGIVGFAWQARIAGAERQDAIAARNAEAAQRALADERAGQLAQVAGFQQRMLGQIDATATGARLMRDLRDRHAEALATSDVPAPERPARLAAFAQELARVNATDAAVRIVDTTFLAPATAAVQREFTDQPLVDATLRQTLATTYEKLGRYDLAQPLLEFTLATRERLLGADDPETARAANDQAVLLERQGRFAAAEPLFRRALATRRRQFGPEHAETLHVLTNLGGNLRLQGRCDEAEPLLLEALAVSRRVLGDDHRDTLVRLNQAGYLRIDQGRLAEAEAFWREAYTTGARAFGPDDPDTIVWTNNLGGLMSSLGKPAEAERLYREALAAARRVHGNDHPYSWLVLANVADVVSSSGRPGEAAPLQREVLDQRRRSFGDEHQDTLGAMRGLGTTLRHLGRTDDAEPLLRQAWTTNRRLRGPTDPETLSSGAVYASLLSAVGRFAEAETLYRDLLATAGATWGPDHLDRLITQNNHGNLLLQMRRPADAEVLLRETLAARKRTSGENHLETLVVQSCFARAREDQGALAEAEALYRDATDRFRATVGDRHPHTLSSLGNVGLVLLAQGRFADAEPFFREQLATTLATAGEMHMRTASARRGLGRTLVGLRRFGEAESELLAAEKATSAAQGVSSDRKATLYEALASCYEAWHAAEPTAGHDGKAATWRQRAAALRGGDKR
jgi:serine/threonine protein kinase/tetratricopeptide (TPR) repeat protein